MTTDTDVLWERLWEAVAEVRDQHFRVPNDAPTDDVIAAIFPIIAAEVRRGQGDALRETADWWAANPDDDVFETDGDTRNWLRDVATEYEAGDQA